MTRFTAAHSRAALRSLPRILLGSATSAQGPLRDAHERIRTPLALTRRVGFVQFSGGTGASTLAAHVLATLGSCRPATSLAVDAAGGQLSLLSRLGWDPHSARDERGLFTVHPRIAAINLESNTLPHIAAQHADWVAHVEPVARFHDLVVTDWGRRPALDDLSAVATSSHVLVITSRAERDALEQAAAIVPALRLVEPKPHLLLVAIDVGGSGKRADAERISQALNIPTFHVPFDPSRGRARVSTSAHSTLRTRIAIAEVTAAIVREAEKSLITPARNMGVRA